MMETQLLACNSNWLDNANRTAIVNDNTSYTGFNQPPVSNVWYPYYYPVYYASPARPIKLTLSEIEKLRKIAKNDASIKTILAKFTDLIEIQVDF